MRSWRNWQTRKTKDLVGNSMQVQFLSTAPKSGNYAKTMHKCPIFLHIWRVYAVKNWFFWQKNLVFGVHFGVHISIFSSPYNKSPSSVSLEELFCYLIKIQIVPNPFDLSWTYQGNGCKHVQPIVPNYPPSKYLQCQVLHIAHKSLQKYDAGSTV